MRTHRISIAALVTFGLLGGACSKGSSVTAGTDTGTPATTSPPAVTASPSTESSPEPSLPDGRHFVYAHAVRMKGGVQQMHFDLAYFLTGDAATQAAKDHGDEHPPPNDYYIVNDNPKLRWLPLSPGVKVRYIPADKCCDLVMGNLDAFAASINGTAMTDYSGRQVPWWITVKGGQIVKIEQQYLP
ncbi:MAG: hypothetical protein HY240_09385 [Actinobacteria bacterium]|nr:hypothetical protein [Actinomycetota bacterium]